MKWQTERDDKKLKLKKIDNYDRSIIFLRNYINKHGSSILDEEQKDLEYDVQKYGETAGLPLEIIIKDIQSARDGGKYRNPYMGLDVVQIRKKKPIKSKTKRCR